MMSPYRFAEGGKIVSWVIKWTSKSKYFTDNAMWHADANRAKLYESEQAARDAAVENCFAEYEIERVDRRPVADPTLATRQALLRASRLAAKRAIVLLEEGCEQDVCDLISAAAAAANAAMNCNQMLPTKGE